MWWYDYFAGIIYWTYVLEPYYDEKPEFEERVLDRIADAISLTYNYVDYFVENSVYALKDLVYSKENLLLDFIDFVLLNWRAWRSVH